MRFGGCFYQKGTPKSKENNHTRGRENRDTAGISFFAHFVNCARSEEAEDGQQYSQGVCAENSCKNVESVERRPGRSKVADGRCLS